MQKSRSSSSSDVDEEAFRLRCFFAACFGDGTGFLLFLGGGVTLAFFQLSAAVQTVFVVLSKLCFSLAFDQD